MKKLLIISALAIFCVGCAGFVNNAQKSLYAATMLADGSMKSYAVYWKWQTNRLGDTATLELQRSNVMALSFKVGTGIAVAQNSLNDYSKNVGTNTTTKAVVQALVNTAIADAGSIPGLITILTGDPSWATTAPH